MPERMSDERLAEIHRRDAAYGPDLAGPQAMRQDHHGAVVWDRRDLLAEVDRLRATVQRVEELADQWDRVHAAMSDYHSDIIRAALGIES